MREIRKSGSVGAPGRKSRGHLAASRYQMGAALLRGVDLILSSDEEMRNAA